MEAEDVHAFAQQGQPIVGQQPGAVGAQRGIDDVEIGPQLGGRGIPWQAQVKLVLRLAVQYFGGGGGEPAADHPQCPPVRLVGAGLLLAAAGQRGQCGVTVISRADIDSSCSRSVSSTGSAPAR